MILIGGQVLVLCLILLVTVSCLGGRAPEGGDPISPSRPENDLSFLVNIDGAPPILHRRFSPRSDNDKNDYGTVEKDVGVRIAFVGNSMFYFNGKANFPKPRADSSFDEAKKLI